jgi:hypothetical protein
MKLFHSLGVISVEPALTHFVHPCACCSSDFKALFDAWFVFNIFNLDSYLGNVVGKESRRSENLGALAMRTDIQNMIGLVADRTLTGGLESARSGNEKPELILEMVF